jgi:hypothetical protein
LACLLRESATNPNYLKRSAVLSHYLPTDFTVSAKNNVRVSNPTRERGTGVEQSSCNTWQMATLVLLVIMTRWLTFSSSRSEDKIKQEIDAKNQLLTAQSNLGTELFNRRSDAYEALYGALINLIDQVEQLMKQEIEAKQVRIRKRFCRKVAGMKPSLDPRMDTCAKLHPALKAIIPLRLSLMEVLI